MCISLRATGGLGRLRLAERRKARILEGGADRKARDGAREVAFRREGSDAAPQPLSDSQRHEDRSGFAESLRAVGREPGGRLSAEARLDRGASEPEKVPAPLLRERRGTAVHL